MIILLAALLIGFDFGLASEFIKRIQTPKPPEYRPPPKPARTEKEVIADLSDKICLHGIDRELSDLYDELALLAKYQTDYVSDGTDMTEKELKTAISTQHKISTLNAKISKLECKKIVSEVKSRL